jgi:hypothetical protein
LLRGAELDIISLWTRPGIRRLPQQSASRMPVFIAGHGLAHA